MTFTYTDKKGCCFKVKKAYLRDAWRIYVRLPGHQTWDSFARFPWRASRQSAECDLRNYIFCDRNGLAF